MTTTVINAGIGGNTTADLLARLDRDVLVHQPDLVIQAVGTNDCCNSRKLLPVETILANYARLADLILPRARLLVVTPPMVHAPYLALRHDAAAYGDQSADTRLTRACAGLRALAAERGLPLVDLRAISAGAGLIGEDPRSWVMNPANQGRPDGVHPTADGYRAIAAAVATVVLSLRPFPRRIVCFGDSITYGEGVAGAGTAEGETYPAWLARILTAAGSPP